jgi:AcrR family transcriptional regulator
VSERESSRRVITYEDAVAGGARLFGRTGALSMRELADELSVSRATIYRVAPGRDRLLGDVLWRAGARMFAAAEAGSELHGVDRLLDVLRRFGEMVMSEAPFRHFIATDPETATRVLFTPAGGVHERFVEANKELIRREVDAGALAPSFDLDSLAYVFSRIYESMWYADLLSGREPDLDVADRAAGAILTSGSDEPH